MDSDQLRSLFEQVRSGEVDIDGAMTRMRHMPFEDLGFAKIDHHRGLRHGIPEVMVDLGESQVLEWHVTHARHGSIDIHFAAAHLLEQGAELIRIHEVRISEGSLPTSGGRRFLVRAPKLSWYHGLGAFGSKTDLKLAADLTDISERP